MTGHGYRLEILVPGPGRGGLVLDAGRLDHPVTGQLQPPAAFDMRLDLGTLDNYALAPSPILDVWFDIWGYLLGLETWHGHRSTHPALPPEPGTLSAVCRDLPDPTALGIVRGAAVRLLHDYPAGPGYIAGTMIVWAGWVTSTATTWRRNGSAITTVAAEDRAARLGNRTRYGALHSGTYTVAQRLAQLAESSPVPVATAGPAVGALVSTTWETSLLAHMAAAAVSARCWLDCTDPNAGATITARESLAFVSAGPLYPPAPRHYADAVHTAAVPSFLALDLAAGVADATALDVTAHGTPDTTATHTDPTGAAVLGVVSQALDVTLDPVDVPAVVGWLLSPFRLDEIVRSVTLRAADAIGDPTYWRSFPQPLERVDVTRLGRTYPLTVAAVAHRFDVIPTDTGPEIRHTVTLATTPAKP